MQIFYTDECPVRCAEYLDDSRVIKMVTESAQILSTALHEHQSPFAKMVYRSTHRNHPCVRWASSTQGNYRWLLRHFRALALEYRLRFGKEHKAYSKTRHYLALGLADMPPGPMTSHANVACRIDKGIDFRHLSPVDHAYRIYLDTRWSTDRKEPVWTGVIREGKEYENIRDSYLTEARNEKTDLVFGQNLVYTKEGKT